MADPRDPLEFETDKGSSASLWIALAMTIALVGWMASGMSKGAEAEAPERARDAVRPMTVAYVTSRAEPVTDVFVAEGQAEAERDTALRAEASGTLAEVLVRRGDDVQAGAVIARIDGTRLTAERTRAEAELERAQREFDNATTLLDRGVGTNDRVTAARSALAAAQSGLTAVADSQGNLDITAPFSGRVEALTIEPGEWIGAGTEVGRIVDLSPLIVHVQVPQQDVARIKSGQAAEVRFISDEVYGGEVTFVGTSADTQTRTFTAEITLPNQDKAIPAGLSAQVRVPTGSSLAHFISPAILSLDTDGTLGIKAVGDGNTVDFYPVQIVRAQSDGLWVEGLPSELDVITVGQGFVGRGEVVTPKSAELIEQAQADEEQTQ